MQAFSANLESGCPTQKQLTRLDRLRNERGPAPKSVDIVTRTFIPRSILINSLPRPIPHPRRLHGLERKLPGFPGFHLRRRFGDQRLQLTLQRAMMPLSRSLSFSIVNSGTSRMWMDFITVS